MQDIFLRENIHFILDSLEEGIHIVDNNGIIVYYNAFAQAIDGIDREHVTGKHLLEIYPSLTDDSSTLLTAIKTGKSIYNKEQTFLNYKGEKITTINTSIPIKSNGRIVGGMEISKDITNIKRMAEQIVSLQSKLYTSDLEKDNPASDRAKFKFDDIIGETPEMKRLKEIGKKAAQTDVSVMVIGDTGTGKELFVQSIHNESFRRDSPFIAQNCAALPANLLEGILFGTTKGGFTGAEDRPGLFELANGGTLFLDEINSMPLELQSKLLRVLQDGRIRRVGSVETIDVDVRLISAINTSPQEAIEEKQLRRDLFYRLNVVSIEIPRLRDRKADIPLLIDHFIRKYNHKFKKNILELDQEVMNIFKNYRWDGNVRELEHVLEGIISITDKHIIELEDVPLKFRVLEDVQEDDLSLIEILDKKEKDLIHDALVRADNNVTKAAEILKIPRQTLQYRIKKLEI